VAGDSIQRYPGRVRLFYFAVSLPVVAALTTNAIRHPDTILRRSLLFWVVVVAAAELMPVPTRQGGLELSLGFPILLAVLMIYEPLPAATIAVVGAFDRRELRRTVQPSTSLFNRAQISLSVMAGSTVFHALVNADSPWPILVSGVIAARVADYLVNVALVTVVIRLTTGVRLRQAMGMLRVGSPSEFLLNYLGLSLIGLIIYELYWPEENFWAVAAFVAPLVFARQMFLRTMALEQASTELKDRERVLRALSNRMAEERQDERLRIAEYLHDDLAQTLFQLTLRLEMAKKRLERRDLPGVSRDLEQIGEIKTRTSAMVRSLVRDLHAAPIGRTGLGDAISSLATELSTERTAIAAQVPHLNLPPPIQLLIYQIAREAVMNAMNHAEPTHIWVTLQETGDGVDLRVRDDGAGFDTTQAQPEGHFGTIMMRERALVAGGSFRIESQVGRGTTVVAHFPEDWIGEGDGKPEPPEGRSIGSGPEPDVSPAPRPGVAAGETDQTPNTEPNPSPRPGPEEPFGLPGAAPLLS
jgi:signal transduction histidine kinase